VAVDLEVSKQRLPFIAALLRCTVDSHDWTQVSLGGTIGKEPRLSPIGLLMLPSWARSVND
jgi:hypothetical protein